MTEAADDASNNEDSTDEKDEVELTERSPDKLHKLKIYSWEQIAWISVYMPAKFIA